MTPCVPWNEKASFAATRTGQGHHWIAENKAHEAAFYRNTLIHHLITRAIVRSCFGSGRRGACRQRHRCNMGLKGSTTA